MKNLRLIPDFNRPQTIVKPAFAGFTLQLLRPSFNTQLLEQGISLSPIHVLTGYLSSKATMIYTHVTKKFIANIKRSLDPPLLMRQNTENKLLQIQKRKNI